MEETWALVKDIDDAKKLYRKKDPAGGKEYNSEFRKCLSRKFNEVRDKAVTLHRPYGLMCHHAWQDGQIIGVSTSLIDKVVQADQKTKKRKAEREAARNDAERENADPNTAGPADREAEQ